MVVLKNKNLKSFVSEKLAEFFKLFKTSLTKKQFVTRKKKKAMKI